MLLVESLERKRCQLITFVVCFCVCIAPMARGDDIEVDEEQIRLLRRTSGAVQMLFLALSHSDSASDQERGNKARKQRIDGTIDAPIDKELNLTLTEHSDLIKLWASIQEIQNKTIAEIKTQEVLRELDKMSSMMANKEMEKLNAKIRDRVDKKIAQGLVDVLDPLQRERLNQLERQRCITVNRKISAVSDNLLPNCLQFFARDEEKFQKIDKDYIEEGKPSNFQELYGPYARGAIHVMPAGLAEWNRRAHFREGATRSIILQLEILTGEQLVELKKALGDTAIFFTGEFETRLNELIQTRERRN